VVLRSEDRLVPRDAPHARGLDAHGSLAEALASDPIPRSPDALHARFPDLPDGQLTAIVHAETQILLPIRAGKDLAGLVALGRKRSGDLFPPTELTLLSAVAEKASAELVRLRATAQASSEFERAEELRALKEDAEEANHAKSRFLAAASHDLRQPLHALGLFVERLANEAGVNLMSVSSAKPPGLPSVELQAMSGPLSTSVIDADGGIPGMISISTPTAVHPLRPPRG